MDSPKLRCNLDFDRMRSIADLSEVGPWAHVQK
jgi:hypothetical protein